MVKLLFFIFVALVVASVYEARELSDTTNRIVNFLGSSKNSRGAPFSVDSDHDKDREVPSPPHHCAPQYQDLNAVKSNNHTDRIIPPTGPNPIHNPSVRNPQSSCYDINRNGPTGPNLSHNQSISSPLPSYYDVDRDVPTRPNLLQNRGAPTPPLSDYYINRKVDRKVPTGPNPLHNGVPLKPPGFLPSYHDMDWNINPPPTSLPDMESRASPAI